MGRLLCSYCSSSNLMFDTEPKALCLDCRKYDLPRDQQYARDQHWLKMAMLCSESSKDPSTKVGAIIIGSENDVISTGYNGFARRVKDKPERYANRDIKYKMVVHAEINAVLFGERWRMKGATLYTWPLPCCSNCAAIVINAGIRRVVAPQPTEDILARWKESLDLAKIQFEEAGVEMVFL